MTAAGHLLELVADDVSDVLVGLVYFGGSVVPMHFDPELLGADELRPTDDVDVLVLVDGSEVQFAAIEALLRQRGWQPNTSPENKLRYSMVSPSKVTVDFVPTFTLSADDVAVRCAAYAAPARLPNGRIVQVLSPGGMLAAKFAAFADRGGGDPLGSADFEDIAMLVACCPAVVADSRRLPPDVRDVVAAGAREMLGTDLIDYAVASIPRTVPSATFIESLETLATLRSS